jgi:hypothetical protein
MNHQQIDQLVKTFNIDTAKPPKAKSTRACRKSPCAWWPIFSKPSKIST